MCDSFFFRKTISVLLTGASGALIKKFKSRKIVLEIYTVIFYQLIITSLFNKILLLLTA